MKRKNLESKSRKSQKNHNFHRVRLLVFLPRGSGMSRGDVNGRARPTVYLHFHHTLYRHGPLSHIYPFCTAWHCVIWHWTFAFAHRGPDTDTMPFPYFENISTDFTGTWTSSRKRKAPSATKEQPAPPAKRKANTPPCPHTMTVMRSSRQLAAEKEQCPICLEGYFSTPADHDKIIPVKMACSHTFCRECIETHLSSSITCPLPWCEAHLPLQPDVCKLCAAWQRDHAPAGQLVVTVRAKEMLGSIKDALKRVALEDDFFELPKTAKDRLLAHVRTTLKRYEWQFHSGIDLAELLDPFLLAVDIKATREHYGSRLSAPAPNASFFPPRDHDPDDYPPDEEPWIAGFFRQWALDYEEQNGEVKEGWGVWAKKTEQDSWEWPYKRITAHKANAEGRVEYLVKWVGQRHFPSWVQGDQLDSAARKLYDKAHGVVHPEREASSRKRRRV